MHWLYNLGIRGYGFALRLAALSNKKARLWLVGRRGWRKKLQTLAQENPACLWVHAASLGEMEQGLPIIKAYQKRYPNKTVVVSFFSPSGYTHFDNEKHKVAKIYLPLDTPSSAQYFVKTLAPAQALFIKYEIWVNFFEALHKAKVPLVLAPAVFRPNQVYFKPWARSFFIPVLNKVSAILVQNPSSLLLLQKQGLQNISLCGDTRFERAMSISRKELPNAKLKAFIKDQYTIIGGSTWPPEEAILKRALSANNKIKLIVAPHEVHPENVVRLKKMFSSFGVSVFSQNQWESNHRVLLVDSVGQLSALYSHGDFAFVGGGFGKGLHSTVEPLAQGLPVAFGPNHKKFIEPTEMMAAGIGFEIKQAGDFLTTLQEVLDKEKQQALNAAISNYLATKLGATEKIMEKLG